MGREGGDGERAVKCSKARKTRRGGQEEEEFRASIIVTLALGGIVTYDNTYTTFI